MTEEGVAVVEVDSVVREEEEAEDQAIEVDLAVEAAVEVLPEVHPAVSPSCYPFSSTLPEYVLMYVGGDRGRGYGAPRGRGGKPGLGRKGPGAVTLEPHKHAGVYIAKGKEHLLVTRNMTPGESVYGEKRVSIASTNPEGEEEKVEYRVWNPFRSKLAAGILGGLDDIHVSEAGLDWRMIAHRRCR